MQDIQERLLERSIAEASALLSALEECREGMEAGQRLRSRARSAMQRAVQATRRWVLLVGKVKDLGEATRRRIQAGLDREIEAPPEEEFGEGEGDWPFEPPY